jgi:TonB family protein
MNPRNARRLLLSAFAISLLIHLLGVRLVHWRLATPVDVPERMTISSVRIVHRIVRTPPPHTPAPLPTAPSTPKAARTTKVLVPSVRNSAGPPRSSVKVATATATPTPSPSPVPTSSAGGCVTPNAPAAVKAAAPVPEIPLDARESAKSGIAQVHVRLSESGAVLEAGIVSSVGDDGLDQLAVNMAKSSRYSPALQKCKAIAGTYEFRVKFVTP